MTSNPTIFEKAIVSSGDYEEALRKLVTEGRTTVEIYEQLAIEDIRGACDLMLPLFQESNGVDGRISLEVLPELATATDKTVSEGLRLAAEVGRANVMIKVPATPEGIPAIRALTAKGVSVNVTLIFSLLQYEEVVEAYLAGLEDRVAAGGSLDGLASVASFFVSRVDTKVDAALEQLGREDLRGKAAVANARVAYAAFQEIFSGEAWDKLAQAGANVQRPLWASTSTKNPDYPDTLYVDELIGPDTVNTMPDATIEAARDHATAARTVDKDIDGARALIEELREIGVEFDDIVSRQLVDEGVAAFSKSYESLLETLERKAGELAGAAR
jgi:transaldolase / glucose-6-phosphate isomerase